MPLAMKPLPSTSIVLCWHLTMIDYFWKVEIPTGGATWCQWDGFIIRHHCKQGAGGKVYNCSPPDRMSSVVSMSPFHLHLLIALVAALTAGQQVLEPYYVIVIVIVMDQQVVDQPNLPVLFSFSQPSHNVAVFRGADLQRAIASGAVRGFGGAGGLGLHSGGGVGHRLAVHQTPALVAPAPALVHSTPVIPVARPTVPVYHPPTRVVSSVVHQSHPAVVAAPATTATYVDPYYSELADYSFEYGVADSISGSQFGDQESRFDQSALQYCLLFCHPCLSLT